MLSSTLFRLFLLLCAWLEVRLTKLVQVADPKNIMSAVTELHCICTIFLCLQMFLSCISCKLLHPATRVISFCTEILVRRRIENCFTRQTMSRRNLLPRSFDHLVSSPLLLPIVGLSPSLSPGCPSEVGLPGLGLVCCPLHCSAFLPFHPLLPLLAKVARSNSRKQSF